MCKRNIASGVDAQKVIVEYLQSDGSTKIFGYMMSDGPLSAATGQILRAWHHKHYHMARKREGRGDAVTGRVLNGAPTGYEIGSLMLTREEFTALGLTEQEARQRGTAYLSERLAELREVARRIGKGVGDGTVLEAYWGKVRGTPYEHTHHFALLMYQLRAHLHYAHAVTDEELAELSRVGRSVEHHDQLHAKAALEHTQRSREQDPGYEPLAEHDWRDQTVLEVSEISDRG